MPAPASHVLFLPCPGGVEPLLADELQQLGYKPDPARGGVRVLRAGLIDAMRLNLHSRLATRVLVELAHGRYRDEADLYRLAGEVDWDAWLTPDHRFRVDCTARQSPLKSLHFAALKVKDALCDRLRDAHGARPSVDTRHPDLPLLLHLEAEHATLYADTSGEPLFKRGWRYDKGDAPLKETLAAAMLAAAGWRGTPESGGALNDPCCGSGTIAIEAAQLACGMAPGRQREFAFAHQLPFAELFPEWQRLLAEAKAQEHPPAVPIFASDVAFRMVDFAQRNAERAGVAHAIRFQGGDALERPAPALPPDLPGTLMLNPPYGERIEVRGKAGDHVERPAREIAEGNDFFSRLAAHWKRQYTGANPWTAWMLTPDRELPGRMRLKESRKIPMWNGPIECRLFRFDLVAGSARKA
ncbi:THUMP domain-containing class I SAM-dependent RNA methyltransferase [Inhella gelatinilytica]|uniref:Class I SAM-dependent RNA methyltransferase n=1 Tax=Inhella gelatinilytica TaxID=2795030 RepID=A0A931IXB2_9BURK|nr:THUMP domain-containing protein [Inhella gelatinilytica]MBH9551581.1 class I SAM-dependent RNA methyltransferase [Inhella gelatinilytica]